jgi:hypothetical protein
MVINRDFFSSTGEITGRHSCKWEGSIKKDFRELGCTDVKSIELSQNIV